MCCATGDAVFIEIGVGPLTGQIGPEAIVAAKGKVGQINVLFYDINP